MKWQLTPNKLLEVAILPLIAWHFPLVDYFAVTIHVCLYSHNCFNSLSDAMGCGLCSCHAMQLLWVGILVAVHLDKGSVHWKEN